MTRPGPSRLLVTGSRHWEDDQPVEEALARYRHRHLTLVYGKARGLDEIAATIWIGWGEKTSAHPARWSLHGKRAGGIRNQEMVNLGGFVACLAFPLPGSRGTWDCVMRAEVAGISVIFPAPTLFDYGNDITPPAGDPPTPRNGDRE